MIEIDIDLIPFGIPEHRRGIGNITIANDGEGDYSTGYYDVTFGDGMKVKVGPHDRRNDVYCLLYLALQERMSRLEEKHVRESADSN